MTDLDILLDYLSRQWLPYEVNEARKRLIKQEDALTNRVASTLTLLDRADAILAQAEKLIPGIPLTDGAGIPEWQRKD